MNLSQVRGASPGELPDAAQVAERAERLSSLVCAVETDALRARAVAGVLAGLPPVEVVMIASTLARRARDQVSAATTVAAVGRALSKGLLDAELVAACLEAARSRADRVVEAMFATGPALREYDRNEEAFTDKKMNALPLGMRRTLTRSRDIDQLARLAHDQDPRVIRELLINPRLTEREALIVASRRPTHERILEQVLASRFGNRARIRAAVAHNPYAPLTLAVRAMTGLSTVQLKAIADDDKVGDDVRRHARSLVVVRQPTPAERHATQAAPSDPEVEEALAELLAELAPAEGEEEPQVVFES